MSEDSGQKTEDKEERRHGMSENKRDNARVTKVLRKVYVL